MTDTLSNLSHEERRFPPPPNFAGAANVKADAYEEASADRLAFWEKQADRLTWTERWSEVLDWSDAPFSKWFVGGKLNVAYNCLDRHVEGGHGDQVAYHWEGEPGDTRSLTYAQLKDEVCKAANALIELGRPDRRPGGDLHAHDPGDGDLDARLRPAGRTAHGGLRRLLGDGAVRPHPRLRRPRRDHGRRRLPAR